MQQHVAVIGPGEGATGQDCADAHRAGTLLAEVGIVVITGGLGGVMAAAARGARDAGGVSVGLLPSADRADGDPAHTVLLPTGLGELRNGLVVRAADAVLAIGGSWGTLSEVALAVRVGTPVVAVRSWDLPAGSVEVAPDIEVAVASVLRLLELR
ncbi:MAG: TIGR00725 family protein [Nitriliruptor sp.]|nr:MAG: TIGR00725 family protein [Nitriliruptor sp.]